MTLKLSSCKLSLVSVSLAHCLLSGYALLWTVYEIYTVLSTCNDVSVYATVWANIICIVHDYDSYANLFNHQLCEIEVKFDNIHK